jgi:catechol 2,3-dioxygenase-like lactoylglutathione lyase family enzyme
MQVRLHHTHIFASDMDRTLKFWQEMLGAEILIDQEIAGARNVMITIGSGRLSIYDQPPQEGRGGAYHHLGIQTDDLDALIKHMRGRGFQFQNDIKDFGVGRYLMAMAPDDILLELFEARPEAAPENVRLAFDMDTPRSISI